MRPTRYARHFAHELNAYIKSASHDLFDYDAKCVYYANKNALPGDCRPNNNDIFPFATLPVNLSKYRLDAHEHTTQTVRKHNPTPWLVNDDVEEEDDEVVETDHTGQFIVPLSNNVIRRNSDSEYSSFCEELTLSPKPPPECIVISSSSVEEGEVYNAPRRKTERKKHKHKSKSSRHRSHSSTRRTRHSSRSKKKSKRNSDEFESGNGLATTSRDSRSSSRKKKSRRKRSKSKQSKQKRSSSVSSAKCTDKSN